MLELPSPSQSASVETGWDEGALRGIFYQSLSEHLKDELASRDEPSSLKVIISLTIHLDNRLRDQCLRSWTRRPVGSSSPLPSPLRLPPLPSSASSSSHGYALEAPEPMQLDRAHTSPEEKERRCREGRWLYCRERGHLVSTCSSQPKEVTH